MYIVVSAIGVVAIEIAGVEWSAGNVVVARAWRDPDWFDLGLLAGSGFAVALGFFCLAQAYPFCADSRARARRVHVPDLGGTSRLSDLGRGAHPAHADRRCAHRRERLVCGHGAGQGKALKSSCPECSLREVRGGAGRRDDEGRPGRPGSAIARTESRRPAVDARGRRPGVPISVGRSGLMRVVRLLAIEHPLPCREGELRLRPAHVRHLFRGAFRHVVPRPAGESRRRRPPGGSLRSSVPGRRCP